MGTSNSGSLDAGSSVAAFLVSLHASKWDTWERKYWSQAQACNLHEVCFRVGKWGYWVLESFVCWIRCEYTFCWFSTRFHLAWAGIVGLLISRIVFLAKDLRVSWPLVDCRTRKVIMMVFVIRSTLNWTCWLRLAKVTRRWASQMMDYCGLGREWNAELWGVYSGAKQIMWDGDYCAAFP